MTMNYNTNTKTVTVVARCRRIGNSSLAKHMRVHYTYHIFEDTPMRQFFQRVQNRDWVLWEDGETPSQIVCKMKDEILAQVRRTYRRQSLTSDQKAMVGKTIRFEVSVADLVD